MRTPPWLAAAPAVGPSALLAFSPAPHPIQVSHGAAPVAAVTGSCAQFEGAGVPLPGSDTQADPSGAVTFGKHRFPRVGLDPAAVENRWPFPTRRRIGPDGLSSRRDPVADLDLNAVGC